MGFMANFLKKTFGALTLGYLIRQYLFCLIFVVPLFCLIMFKFKNPESIYLGICILIQWGLYPYSRFVYEGVVNYIVGDNLFIVRTELFLIVKIWTMALCFGFAWLLAPLGLLYLYFRSP